MTRRKSRNQAQKSKKENENVENQVKPPEDTEVENVENQVKPPEDTEVENCDDVNPQDSVSQIGSVSKVSGSVTTQRQKLLERRAALEARAAILKEEEELEKDEMKCRRRRRDLELKRLEVEMNSAEKRLAQAEGSIASKSGEVLPTFPTYTTSLLASANASVASYVDSEHVVSFLHHAKEPEKSLVTSTGNENYLKEFVSDSRLAHKQLLDAIQLPATQIVSFDGDPLQYYLFIRMFEASVERSTVDDCSKLARLIQYCTGAARQVIMCCLAMNSDVGYRKAKKLLEERFGNPYVITEAWLEKVTKGPNIKPSDSAGLRMLSDDLCNCRETVNAIGCCSEINNQRTLVKIVERLPLYLQYRWRKVAHDIRTNAKGQYQNPTIDDIAKFIRDAADEANDPVYGNLTERSYSTPHKDGSRSDHKGRGIAMNVVSHDGQERVSSMKKPCMMCSGQHNLFACSVFKSKTVDDRVAFAREHKLCFNCLRGGHRSSNCKDTRVCNAQGCGKRHATLLHHVEAVQHTSNNATTILNDSTMGCALDESVTSGGVEQAMPDGLHNYAGAGFCRTVLPIVPVVVHAPSGEQIRTHALLDTGSTNTFCSQKLADKLGLRGSEETLTLATLSNPNSKFTTAINSLDVSDIECKHTIHMERVYSSSSLPLKVENLATAQDIRRWPHLCNLKLPDIPVEDIDLLIGQDVPEALIPRRVVTGDAGSCSPYAIQTLLGWTLNGPVGNGVSQLRVTVNFIDVDSSLEHRLEKFWMLDTYIPRDNVCSFDDKKALDIWKRSLTFVDGHYQLEIPFKRDPAILPNNQHMAKQRLDGLKRRLLKDSSLLEAYQEGVRSLLSKGYAESVPDSEIAKEAGKAWYLPHHPVINVNKPGKVRVVFDCAASCENVSLNQAALQGPDLTNKLLGVLIRFREEKFAFMADIEAMFHQVLVTPEQRDYLRFLWWQNDDPNGQVKVYRMRAHLFGGVWSPSCCNYVLKRLASDSRGRFDVKVCETLERNFYVDDCLKSMQDEEAAVLLALDLKKLLATGGFNLTKWISNSRMLLEAFANDHDEKKVKISDLTALEHQGFTTERALGVSWNVSEDTFGFSSVRPCKPFTRRGILSVVSSVYDPLGFAGPFIITAKVMMQDLCRKQIGWDDPLCEKDDCVWSRWLHDLSLLPKVKLVRCFKPADFGSVTSSQLHHFADASSRAYGVATYLRQLDTNGRVCCSLVMSRSRVAPIRQITIPRLELSAAVLSVKVDELLKKELDMNLAESVFWTDSMLVLTYIRNDSKRFHTFVENRVSEIRERSTPSQWRHVASALNPADHLSRGMSTEQLKEELIWWHGPPFLMFEQSSWPANSRNDVSLTGDPEMKIEKCSYATDIHDSVIDRLFKRWSSWFELKRSVARLRIMFDILLAKTKKLPAITMPEYMSVKDLKLAEKAILRFVQGKMFHEEMKALGSNNSLKRSSKLAKLSPVLVDGLLCVGGRVKNNRAEAINPVLLPKDSIVSRLIVKHYHELSGHSGKEYVISLLREKFWIIGARRLIQDVRKACFTCKRCYDGPCVQKMADLPSVRVTPDLPPFTNVGIDVFGPFLVKIGRSQHKRYGCLFTCLACRAIHIEILHSLDTDSFINALQRFISRRGQPTSVWTDNGTNFVGGYRELRTSVQAWNKDKMRQFALQRDFDWHFNPPTASHMGGVWERQIRTVRKVLLSVMQQQTVSDETLVTLMCVVEGIVNSRPLTTVSDDVDDLQPLTPNHILRLRGIEFGSPGIFVQRDNYVRRRWRQCQYLADLFWSRWVKEYLPTLQQRSKWMSVQRDLCVGDVVLVMGENTHRCNWPLGRVVETLSSSDNHVRSVRVATKDTTFVRPIHKLCLLEPVDV